MKNLALLGIGIILITSTAFAQVYSVDKHYAIDSNMDTTELHIVLTHIDLKLKGVRNDLKNLGYKIIFFAEIEGWKTLKTRGKRMKVINSESNGTGLGGTYTCALGIKRYEISHDWHTGSIKFDNDGDGHYERIITLK